MTVLFRGGPEGKNPCGWSAIPECLLDWVVVSGSSHVLLKLQEHGCLDSKGQDPKA